MTRDFFCEERHPETRTPTPANRWKPLKRELRTPIVSFLGHHQPDWETNELPGWETSELETSGEPDTTWK